MEFYEILRMHRESLGLTKKELANILNISPSNMYKFERGLCIPQKSTINKMCQFFGLTQQELLGSSDKFKI